MEIAFDPLPVAAIHENLDEYLGLLDSCTLGKSFQTLHHLQSGKYLMVSSSIDSNFNIGVLALFENFSDIPEKKLQLYLNPRQGPCCRQSAILARSNGDLALVGFDSGVVALIDGETLAVEENKQYFHDIVTTLKLSSNQKRSIGGDFSGRLAMIDVEQFEALHYFDPAHIGPVNDVDFHPSDDRQFVSVGGGGDNQVLVWDIRSSTSEQGRGAADIALTTSSTPTAVHWSTNSPNHLLVATETGNVVDFDLRTRSPRVRLVDTHRQPIGSIQVLPTKQSSRFAFISRDHRHVNILQNTDSNTDLVGVTKFCNQWKMSSLVTHSHSDAYFKQTDDEYLLSEDVGLHLANGWNSLVWVFLLSLLISLITTSAFMAVSFKHFAGYQYYSVDEITSNDIPNDTLKIEDLLGPNNDSPDLGGKKKLKL